MTIEYVGGQCGGIHGTVASTSVTFSLTGGLASAPQAGDLVVVSYAVGSTASGTYVSMTIKNDSAVDYTTVGGLLFSNDTFEATLRVGYRFMPATTETGCVLSPTTNTSWAGAYTIHVYRGVDESSPMDVAAVTATGINSRLADPAAITPSTPGAVIQVVGAAAMDVGAVFTAAYLTGLQRDVQAEAAADVTIASGYVAWTSGAYDPAAFGGGGTATTSDAWAAVTLALRPLIVTGGLFFGSDF